MLRQDPRRLRVRHPEVRALDRSGDPLQDNRLNRSVAFRVVAPPGVVRLDGAAPAAGDTLRVRCRVTLVTSVFMMLTSISSSRLNEVRSSIIESRA